MFKSTLLIISTISLLSAGYCQQEYQISNAAVNPYVLNPAAGGLSDVVQLEITGRTQWMGYNGGPRTMMLSGHSQINIEKKEKVLSEYNSTDESFFALPEVSAGKVKHVIGGKMSNDAIGPFSKTAAYGSYAIHIPLIRKVNIGAGVGLGWSNFRIDESRVVLYQEDDQSYQTFLGNTSLMNFADVSAGLVVYHKCFYLGLSTTQLLNNKVHFSDAGTLSNFSRHYFVIGRYTHEFNSSLSLEPMMTAKFEGSSPSSIDLGARIKFNKSSWFGLQYRSSNALILQVGSTLIKNLYLSYAYEHSTGKISTSANSTHEIQLGIFLGNNRNIDREIKDSKTETP